MLDLGGCSSLLQFFFNEYDIKNMILHTENSFLSLLFIVAVDTPYLARPIHRIGLDSLEVIRRIGNCSNAFSYEVQALILRIFLVEYGVLTWDACPGSSPVYCAGDDKISNKGRSSHNRERKSQSVRNSDGSSTSHPPPKSGKYEEKNAFHTSHRVFCYTKMPFKLKNVGATYKRLVEKAFDRQIGRNLEVYVDDHVIKSHGEQEAIRDIEETFRTLRRINMKLNPKKCTFVVEEECSSGIP
uniref:Reverse transcriptase domain-containing protein n=1 Tax=Tanacetum cinerariifolium TaxID=118510 RepID=A0A6L2LTK7_TANCI|nr:reverse transcriptase domain-containing protein [Tanacetum cinerariifolium]